MTSPPTGAAPSAPNSACSAFDRTQTQRRRRRIALVASLAIATMFASSGAVSANAADMASLLPAAADRPELTLESFADPSAGERPKYRWWMPRGAADGEQLAAEVQIMADAGAGGAEISPFPNPGGAHTTGQGLLTDGWMSETWNENTLRVQQAAASAGFIVDDTVSGLGADAASVPIQGGLNSQVTSKRYVTAYSILPAGEAFDGNLPVTTATSYNTRICAPAKAGSSQVSPVLTGAYSPGDVVTVGQGDEAEQRTVASVGEGTWGCGLTTLAHTTGDTMIFVDTLGVQTGTTVTIGTGAQQETVTVTDLGSGLSEYEMPMSAPSEAGAMSIDLVFMYDYAVGDYVQVGQGDGAELVNIAAISGNTMTFTSALTKAHAAGSPAKGLGSGTTVSPLANNHEQGTPVAPPVGENSYVRFTEPLAKNHEVVSPMTADATKTPVATLAIRCETDCAEPERDPAAPRSLVLDSVIDVTQDAADGRLDDTSWRDAGGTWVIYVHDQVNDEPFSKGPFSPLAPDYAVDHLNETGAQAVIDHWETVLTPEMRESIANNPAGFTSLFEDSLEMPFTPKWTGDMVEEWKQLRGYDPTPYLPVLSGTDQQARAGSDATSQFAFAGLDNARFQEDYRQTWSDLFTTEFVTPLQEWTSSLGMGMRMQLYGSFPIDTSAASGLVAIPEGEGLGFDNDVNTFSIVASGAHHSGATTVSSECCAVQNGSYVLDIAGKPGTVLDNIYRSYAGGVNQIVWHGFNHRDATGAQWPGYHAWSPEAGSPAFSEPYGPRQPIWGAGDIGDINDALGRTQLVLKQGQPAYDLAVYDINFGRGTYLGPEAPTITDSGPLASAGYTTEFLSPEYLRGEGQLWDGESLFPDASSYDALVLNQQATMPVDVAERIVSLVREGMPLVVIGELPSSIPGVSIEGADARLAELMGELATLIEDPSVKAVRVADEAAAAEALRGVDVSPAAEKATEGAGVSLRRHTDGSDYYYLYNNSDTALTNTWTLEGSGAPVMLDAWSGKVAPIGLYTENDDSIAVELEIGPRDAVLVALTDGELASGTSALHATSTDAQQVAVDDAGKLSVRSSTGGATSTTLSTGSVRTVDLGSVPAPQQLGAWNLELESWQPGSDASAPGYAYMINKVDAGSYTVAAGEDGALPAWNALTDDGSLDRVSGIGTYTTTISLPESGWVGGHGAVLDLGTMSDTVSVAVNGTNVPVNLQDRSSVDLGGLLHGGDNTLNVTVASTLGNAATSSPTQAAGLFGPVTLTPYAEGSLGSAPTVTEQPTAVSVEVGASATFTAAADGNPAPTVQWQRADTAGTWADIDGATDGTLTITEIGSDAAGNYRAVFTNEFGTATTDEVSLTITGAGGSGTDPGATSTPGTGGSGSQPDGDSDGQAGGDLAVTGTELGLGLLALLAAGAVVLGIALKVRRQRIE